MPTTTDLAQAIATMEGFFKSGTLAQRNNNPGNLRAGPRSIGTDARGFAVYATAADGWSDLYRQIGLDAGRGLTLAQFMGKYAPSIENDTAGYLAFVSNSIGADPSIRLASLEAGNVANFPTAPRPGRVGRAKANRPTSVATPGPKSA